MEEKEKTGMPDMSEFYTRAYMSSLDVFNSWAKIMSGSPPVFKDVDMECWFRPFFGSTEEWGKAYKGFSDMAKIMPLPFQSVKDMSEAAAKGIDSYVKVYNAWLKSADKVAREGYEIGRRLGAGEEVDTGKFFDAIKEAYDNVTAIAVEGLKTRPFTGVENIEEAIKKSLDSFPEEQKIAKDFFQELFDFTTKVMNLSSSAMDEGTKTFADMLENGNISADNYKKMIDAYGDMIKHTVEILRLPAVLLPGYKKLADDTTNWVRANLDLSVAWTEINLRLYQGIAKSAVETRKAAEDLFEEKNVSSPDDFYKAWTGISEKAMDIMARNSKIYESIPGFIGSYTGWLAATNKLYRSIMTPPGVSKEDIDKMFAELEKIQRSGERRTAVAEG